VQLSAAKLNSGMPLRTRIALVGCLAALGGLFSFAPVALASHGETVFFEAPTQLLSPAARPAAITQMQALGVHAVRILLEWNTVVPKPNAKKKPSGFDPTNPADYNWGQYDPLIAEMQTLGWKVLLTVTGPIPCWASSCKKDQVTGPNPAAYGKFMQAVGRHYGSYVKLYSIWNEPNQPQQLLPQYSRGKLVSPTIYRSLFLDGYAGLQASGNFTGMKVLMGETSPIGVPSEGIPAPLTFLRGVLCLNSHYVKTKSCGKLPAAGYAQHPYTQPPYGPFWVPNGPGESGDVTMGTLGRLVSALNRSAAAGAIRANMPVYVTEFGIQSHPDPYLGVAVAEQAEFDAISERIAWDNPRVASFDQYLLSDDPPLPGGPLAKWSGFQSGLEYYNGKPKPDYNGWRLPLTVTWSGSKVAFWGIARPTAAATSVVLEYSSNNGHSWHSLLTAQTNANGYWQASGNFVHKRVWRAQWTSPGGTVYVGPTIRAYTSTSLRQSASGYWTSKGRFVKLSSL
jgi:hypothetical protein